MLGEQGTGLEADLEVIYAEVGGVGVGHVNGYQWDIGLFEDVGHARRGRLLDLELEHQIYALGDELFGVLNSNVRVIAVVEDQKLDAGGCGRSSR